MGYELANVAGKKGYKVTLISGPTGLEAPKGVRFLSIETAVELLRKVRRELKKADILIMTSAVSDFRPVHFSEQKLKSKKPFVLKFVRNPDILKSITPGERKNKIIVGFALETENLLAHARQKLCRKRLDLIVANKCGPRNTPFGSGRKTVYLVDKHGRIGKLEKATKNRIARAIIDRVKELCYTPD